MKDWKGNVIREGDTVLIYRFKEIGYTMSFGVFDMAEGAQPWKEQERSWEETVVPDRYTWELIKSIDIGPPGRTAIVGTHDVVPVNLVDFLVGFSFHDSEHAVCIKGKSDNQEEFFLSHFK